jgi:hypothetical protein
VIGPNAMNWLTIIFLHLSNQICITNCYQMYSILFWVTDSYFFNSIKMNYGLLIHMPMTTSFIDLIFRPYTFQDILYRFKKKEFVIPTNSKC